MVSTLDFESSDPSSNLGRTFPLRRNMSEIRNVGDRLSLVEINKKMTPWGLIYSS